jgi:hypothetical protein
VNPGGGAGWDESPLDIQIPDDARELERDVLAYHRELRAERRRSRLRRLAGPLASHGTIMPVLASIMAVCLVAGAMLSVATFGPTTAPAERTHPPSATASNPVTPITPRASASASASATPSAAAHPTAAVNGSARATGTSPATRSATPSASATRLPRSSPSGRVASSRAP